MHRSRSITLLLGRIDMPDHVVWQSIHTIASALGHLCEALSLSLVLESVTGEVDAGAMDVCFHDDVDAADAVEQDFDVLVGAPVAHERHVLAVRVVLLVTFGEDDGLFQCGDEGATFLGFLPRVVVDWRC
jgi:hypothetical protein